MDSNMVEKMNSSETLWLPELHSDECKNQREDVEKMKKLLSQCPELLERPKRVPSNPYNLNRKIRTSNLIDAAMRGHEKCMIFLISAGADKTNLLYNKLYIDWYLVKNSSQIRNNVLKLFENKEDYKINLNFYFDGLQKDHCFILNYMIVNHSNKIDKVLISTLLKAGMNINPMPSSIFNMGSYTTLQPTTYALLNGSPARVLKLLLMHGAITCAKEITCAKSHFNNMEKEAMSLLHTFNMTALVYPEVMRQKLDVLVKFGVNMAEKNRFGQNLKQARKKRRVIQRDLFRRFRGVPLFHSHLYHSGRYSELRSVRSFKDYIEITKMIEETQSKTLSLKDMCRIALVKEHKENFPSFVHNLEARGIIPRSIASFLQGEDLEDDLCVNNSGEVMSIDIDTN